MLGEDVSEVIAVDYQKSDTYGYDSLLQKA